MTNRPRISALLLAAAAGGIAASANAEVIYTLTYHDLAGSYVQSANPNVGQFTAAAVNTANLQSAYEASRLTPAPTGQATFEAGFVSNPLNPADFVINLSELLRVIQFYNSGGYHCADTPAATEDGYVPGTGANQTCAPYDTDYNPQDWAISLTELLRVIQFYNSNGYTYCPGAGTEDGFCPGA